MEAKLKEYRALRRRKEIIEKTKEKFEKSKLAVFDFLTPKIFKDMGKDKTEEVLLVCKRSKYYFISALDLLFFQTRAET